MSQNKVSQNWPLYIQTISETIGHVGPDAGGVVDKIDDEPPRFTPFKKLSLLRQAKIDRQLIIMFVSQSN